MENFYEMATIVLGCVVIAQYMAKKKLRLDMQRCLHLLDRIAQKDWTIHVTSEGYKVLDEEGDIRFSVRDHRSKR